jgi:NAD(P)-dependent dehydrogenase (short-subunit alcohol dehydrogenase family)
MDVLIVGASRGIGAELVWQSLDAGATVTATARSEAGVQSLQQQGAEAFVLDVADTASAAGLGWRLDGRRFDEVWLVAGVSGPRLPALQPPSEHDFDAVMRTNVLGPMRVLPQLQDALAPQARVAVLSSLMGSIGERGSPGHSLYRASKAAVNSVLKDAALAWQGRAICVAVHPGWVRTDMGGAQAPLSVQDSVADLRRLLAGLTPAHSGRFLNHDGREIAW